MDMEQLKKFVTISPDEGGERKWWRICMSDMGPHLPHRFFFGTYEQCVTALNPRYAIPTDIDLTLWYRKNNYGGEHVEEIAKRAKATRDESGISHSKDPIRRAHADARWWNRLEFIGEAEWLDMIAALMKQNDQLEQENKQVRETNEAFCNSL